MTSVGNLLNVLNPYNNKKKVIVEDQDTDDIIKAILDGHDKYKGEYKKIAHFFKGRNNKETALKIWQFLKKNIQYIIESEQKQTIKSPAALLAQGFCDCKNYSLFTAGILDNLNIPFCYRFASYKIWDKQPGHVFVVMYPGTSYEIWIDAVLSKFDYKKQYQHKIDKKPKMAIYSISGIGGRKQRRKARQTARKTARRTRRAKRRAEGRTFGQRLKKGLKGVLKIAAAPARAAFLGLVAINVHNMAKKLQVAYAKSPTKVQRFWESTGGQISKLLAAINKGAKKRRILGFEENPNIIGAPLPVILASAAPIIAKAVKLLRSIGINPEELVQVAKNAVNAKAQELAAKALVPKAEQEEEYEEEADAGFEQEETE
jgi:hypothetical protein